MEIFFQALKSIFIVFQVSVTFSSITQQQSEQALHGENTNCGLFYMLLPFNQTWHYLLHLKLSLI